MGAPKKGDVLLEKYRVEETLGQGGMGVVVAAQHLELDDRVAIKLLLDDMRDKPEYQERFLREARAVRRIKSEHVARVSDVGRLQSGELYIVMEYLEGMSLADVRRQRGALDVEVAVDYVLQALEALAEAHLHGIIHRDLKPANLFLTARADGTPLVKVLDFGISKMHGGEVPVTRTGALLGSPNYMAPEQIASPREVDPRVDIWAMGVVLYSLVTGKVPFGGSSVTHTFALVLEGLPAPPSAVRPGLPPELDAVILRCLEKSPDARFPTVAALAAALGPFAPPRSRVSVDRIARVLGVPVVPSPSEDPNRISYGNPSLFPQQPSEAPVGPMQSESSPPRAHPTMHTGTGMSRTIDRVKSAAQATGLLALVGAGCAAFLGVMVHSSISGRSPEPSPPAVAGSSMAPAGASTPAPPQEVEKKPSEAIAAPTLTTNPDAAPPSTDTVMTTSKAPKQRQREKQTNAPPLKPVPTNNAPSPPPQPTSQEIDPGLPTGLAPPPNNAPSRPPEPATAPEDESGLPGGRN